MYNARMDKNDAIRKIHDVVCGSYAIRESYPMVMRGEIAKDKWNDGVFAIGFEYGYIKALMDTFDIAPDELRVKK